MSGTSTTRRIARLANPPRLRLAVALVAGVLAIGSAIGLMAASGYLISAAALQPPILTLSVVIVAVRFFGVSRGVFRYLERLISHDATLRSLVRLRVALYERLEPLVPADLGTFRVGDLLERFVQDIDQLQNLTLRAYGPIAIAVGASALAIGTAAVVDPLSGAALAVGLAVAGIGVPLLHRRLTRAASRREAPARGRLAADLVEALTAAPDLAAYGRTTATVGAVASAGDDLDRLRRRGALTTALTEGLMTSLTLITATIVLLVAARDVENGLLDGVFLALLVFLALAAFEALRPLPTALEQVGLCDAAATRVLDVVDRTPHVVDPAQPATVTDPTSIDLVDVRYRYEEVGPWILDGVSLHIGRGETIALVGPSGTGKTTLAELLMRFRDPTEGAILLGGHDLRTLDQETVRSWVGLAGQEAHLFPTSIRENLRIAAPDADDDALFAALDDAGIGGWVQDLPDGLDTQIREQGTNISGGQRQRIALARAILADWRFLVLDEPTAHLDEATADIVLRDLLTAARQRGLGVVLITHRRVERTLVDRVVELRDGRLRDVADADS